MILATYDRTLIDRAVAAGVVRRIPAGVFGIDPSTGRPYPSIEAAIAAHEATVRTCRAPRCQTIDERDRKIMECRRSGLTLRETAARTGMALSVVHRRFRKFRPNARW